MIISLSFPGFYSLRILSTILFLTYSLHSDYPATRRGCRRGSRWSGPGSRPSRAPQSEFPAPRSNVNRCHFSRGPVRFEFRGFPSTDAATRCRGMQQGTQPFLRARLGSSATRASEGVKGIALRRCTRARSMLKWFVMGNGR